MRVRKPRSTGPHILTVGVDKALAGFRIGKASVVVDPVDRTVVRLPRRVIRRLDNWALRHLTGS